MYLQEVNRATFRVPAPLNLSTPPPHPPLHVHNRLFYSILLYYILFHSRLIPTPSPQWLGRLDSAHPPAMERGRRTNGFRNLRLLAGTNRHGRGARRRTHSLLLLPGCFQDVAAAAAIRTLPQPRCPAPLRLILPLPRLRPSAVGRSGPPRASGEGEGDKAPR